MFCVFLSHLVPYYIYMCVCVCVCVCVRKGNRDISSGFDSAIRVSSRTSQTYFSG